MCIRDRVCCAITPRIGYRNAAQHPEASRGDGRRLYGSALVRYGVVPVCLGRTTITAKSNATLYAEQRTPDV